MATYRSPRAMKNWVRFILVAVISLCLVLGNRRYTVAQVDPSQLVRQAQKQYHLGKSERSLELLDRAGQIYQDRGEILPQAQVLALTSLAQQQQGNWDLARSYLDRSFTLIKNIPNSSSKLQVQAQIGNSQGHYYLATGQYSQALTNWQQAEKLYRQVDDRAGVAGTVLSQAEALSRMGFHRRACNLTLTLIDPTQQRCQDLQSSTVVTTIEKAQADAAPWLADSFNSISNSLLLMGKLDFAKSFVRATRNVSSSKDFAPNTQAKIILNLGNIDSAIANLAKERADLAGFRIHRRQALKYFQQLEANKTYKFTGQLNRLSLLIACQEWSQAIGLANNIQLSEGKHNLYAQVKFANSLFSLQQHNLALKYTPPEIAQMYLDVISQAKQSGDSRLESSAWGNLGEMYDPQLSLEYTPQQLYERALILAQSTNSPEMAYRWQWRLGRIYRQQGSRNKAIALYQAAIANLDSLRSDLAALEKEVQYQFKEQIEPVYRELADLLLTDNPSDRDLQAARDTIEALQIAELDNYFQDACITFEPKSINAIDPNAALIYTIVLPDRLEIIMAQGDRSTNRQVFHHYSTSIDRNQLEQTIALLRLYITEPDRTREVEHISQQIYSWLMQPLTADLSIQQPKTLVFVLDGILQTIPMSVLYDGKQYLIEKYAIALTPGLRLLNSQPDSRPLSFLTGGISRYLQVDNLRFAALKNVPNELKTAGQQEHPPLLNLEFTPDNLLKQLNQTSASVVHLATHGQFRANPQQTFLLMWQKLLTIKEFSNILQSRIKAYRRPIKLLVLSACDTATGDRRATLGLAGIAVRSGALSTIATLWQINDESTTELMKHFYKHLNHNSKAEALRLAQLELWLVSEKDWQVSAFWSAYIIIGNWQ